MDGSAPAEDEKNEQGGKEAQSFHGSAPAGGVTHWRVQRRRAWLHDEARWHRIDVRSTSDAG
jgi:hypothetical protein